MNRDKQQTKVLAQGKYLLATRFGSIVYIAGMTPRINGELIQSGKIKMNESLETYKDSVRQATENALLAAENTLTKQEKLEKILNLNLYINAEDTFTSHSFVADYASEYLFERLGEMGIGSRVAIGVASLPNNVRLKYN
ncbi:RidA family protein [Pseudogracilibacillus sp. SO30301A]|uniref:RidA family protein n=1 Tax=Pseudogracilibacillus sp. SO30301A TaxID=3098291 RepID=UPI00300DD519